MTARVVLADATAFVRLAVRVALMNDGVRVEAEVATAAQAVEAVVRHRVDAVLIGAELDPEMAAVREMRVAAPQLAIVVLDSGMGRPSPMAALRAGACGLIAQDSPPERLAAIVRGVMDGEAAIPRRVVRQLLDDLLETGQPPTVSKRRSSPLGLSTREEEALSLLCEGLCDRLVAQRMRVSEITVRRHIGAAVQKLGGSRRQDAIDSYRRAVGIGHRAA